MLRDLIFIILISATFLPNFEIINCIYPFEVPVVRKIMAGLIMGTMFLVISRMRSFDLVRFLIQSAVYYAVLFVLFQQGPKRTFVIYAIMIGVNVVTEIALILMLESTLIGFEQLFLIDAFYALTLMLETAILSAVAYTVKQLVSSKKRKKTDYISEIDSN